MSRVKSQIIVLIIILCGFVFSNSLTSLSYCQGQENDYREEPECKKRLRSLHNCPKGIINTDQICKLLFADMKEDPNSIQHFIMKIWNLDDEVRSDLICARLMGFKKISGMNLKNWFNQDKWYFEYQNNSSSLTIEFYIEIPSQYFERIISLNNKIKNFLQLKKNLSPEWLKQHEFDYGATPKFEVCGNIENVELKNVILGLCQRAKININNVKVLGINYLHFRFDGFEKFLTYMDTHISNMLNLAYDDYMNTR